MATAQQQNQKTNGQTEQKTPEKSLLEQSIEMTNAEKFPQLKVALDSRISIIEKLLPDFLKGQGERLAERALLTFKGKADLHNCTPASFVKCVLDAAELGLAIDGRLCHAVPYNNRRKVEENGKIVERSFREVQLNVDYKGLIAVAKRNKLIQDCWSRIVYADDNFTFYEENGKTIYRLEPALTPRKGVTQLGVLSVATHAEGWYRVDWMFTEEIHSIRARSKSYIAGGGPWISDENGNTVENEMHKKSGTRRLLKTFADDPGLARLFEIDNQDFEDGFEPPPKAEPIGQQVSKLKQLTNSLRKPSPTHYVGPELPHQETTQQQTSSETGSGTDPSEESPTEPETDNQGTKDNSADMNQYRQEVSKAVTVIEKQAVYDSYFGPDCEIPWTMEERTLGAKIKTEQQLALQATSKKEPKAPKGQLFDTPQNTAQQAGV